MDTGFTSQDAQSDFNRSRRRAAMALLAGRLRGQAGDVTTLLPFEEVVAALGRTGERRIGLKTIPLETIVGSVDRTAEFDSDFRPAHEPGADAVAAGQRGAAPRQGDAADRRLPRRRAAFRQRWAPSRLRRPPPRPRGDRGLRHRDHHARLTRGGPAAQRPAGEEPRAALPGAGPAGAGGARAHLLQRSRERLRPARRRGRGLGLPADPGARRAPRPPRDRRGLVPGRVRAGARGAARGRADRQGNRGRCLPPRRARALHAAAHPRMGRRGHRRLREAKA